MGDQGGKKNLGLYASLQTYYYPCYVGAQVLKKTNYI